MFILLSATQMAGQQAISNQAMSVWAMFELQIPKMWSGYLTVFLAEAQAGS